MPRRRRWSRTDYQPALQTESEHESVLMHFFAVHRIATAYDVMKAFPDLFNYHNKTIRHLNRLANQGYLNRHELANRWYVFNITSSGYTRCRDPDVGANPDQLPLSYTEPTGKQVRHELLVTRAATSLYECMQRNPNIQILEEGRFGLRNIRLTDERGVIHRPFEHLVPDYWYLCRDRSGLMFRMVEAVRGVESVDNLRTMIADYDRWGRTPSTQYFLNHLYRKWGAANPVPEFQVHCILESSSWKHTDAWKERMTMMQTFHASPKMQGRIWTTTSRALEAALAEGGTINHRIWHRGKDLLGERRQRWLVAREGARTRLFEGYMGVLPVYPLFA